VQEVFEFPGGLHHLKFPNTLHATVWGRGWNSRHMIAATSTRDHALAMEALSPSFLLREFLQGLFVRRHAFIHVSGFLARRAGEGLAFLAECLGSDGDVGGRDEGVAIAFAAVRAVGVHELEFAEGAALD
jgi:hypothetical protein